MLQYFTSGVELTVISLILTGGGSVALAVDWDFGPRLYHASGTQDVKVEQQQS